MIAGMLSETVMRAVNEKKIAESFNYKHVTENFSSMEMGQGCLSEPHDCMHLMHPRSMEIS